MRGKARRLCCSSRAKGEEKNEPTELTALFFFFFLNFVGKKGEKRGAFAKFFLFCVNDCSVDTPDFVVKPAGNMRTAASPSVSY